MNRSRSSLLAAGFALLSAAGLALPAQADILQVQAFDESYIRASEGNQGANSLFLVGDTANASDYLRAVLAFDLSNPLLAGATINSVTLSLRVNSVDSGASDNTLQTLEVHALAAPFVENSVTWTSRDGTNNWTTPGGDFGPTLATVDAIAKGAGSVQAGSDLLFTSAGFTTDAGLAVGGNYYLLIKLATEDSSRSIFRFSADNGGTNGFTTLTIDYTPVPEPGAAPLLAGAGALALAFLRHRHRRGAQGRQGSGF
jgi:hypothetical protein